jgi:hypothetical protein
LSLSLLIAIVGKEASTVNLTVLLGRTLGFPAASVNLRLETLTTPLAVLPVVGVNAAV